MFICFYTYIIYKLHTHTHTITIYKEYNECYNVNLPLMKRMQPAENNLDATNSCSLTIHFIIWSLYRLFRGMQFIFQKRVIHGCSDIKHRKAAKSNI